MVAERFELDRTCCLDQPVALVPLVRCNERSRSMVPIAKAELSKHCMCFQLVDPDVDVEAVVVVVVAVVAVAEHEDTCNRCHRTAHAIH
jgi:hypothetical protein